MAFGGFFGGSGSNDKDKDTSSSTTPSEFAPPTPTNGGGASITPFGQSPSAGATSSLSSNDIRSRIQQALLQQSNVANAKALISKINENCFDHCVTAPGSSLSSKENSCLSACMEKYIDGWNVVSKSYIGRIQREGASIAGGAGGQGGVF